MMATAAFKTAARKTDTYVFDYEAEVAAFYAAWPDKLDKIFFVDISTKPIRVIHPDEDHRTAIDHLLKSNPVFAKKIARNQKRHHNSMTLSAPELPWFRMMLLNPPVDAEANVLGDNCPAAMHSAFIFDHELMHCLAPADKTPLINEVRADIHGLIRLYQRFGHNAEAARTLMATRAFKLAIAGDRTHFTTPAIAKLLAEDQKQFTGMPPLLVVCASISLGAPDAQTLKDIGTWSKKLESLRTSGYIGDIDDVLNLSIKNSTPQEFEWGRMALEHLFNNQAVIGRERLYLTARQDVRNARRRLNRYAAKLQAVHT